MTTRALVFLTCFAVACGSGERAADTDSTATAVNEDSLEAAAAAQPELPPMPDYPARESGKLRVAAVGAFALSQSWPARAGRCARPSMVMLIAEEPGSGATILLDLPEREDLTGSYPIKLVDSVGVLEPPASQMGFQFFDSTSADAYQGSSGDVEVRELTDQRVSGQLAVTVRHIRNNRLANVSGTFEHVNVEALPIDWCDRAAAARDSLNPAPDSSTTTPDSVASPS